ncbi:MAG: hypothetical protein J0L91_04895 [Burkholderiales bacterium]|nr:hypothetical protein [Burkholderiales bacterium]MCC7115807.1 hypothetical protein [Burkholderiales bacterium]
MFGFGKTVKDPLADARSAERWFSSQPSADPLAMHAELLGALGTIAERGRSRSPSALEAVFRADTLALGVREALTAQYIEHAARSSRIEHQLWSALFDHSQAFLLAYTAFMQDVSDHAQNGKWQALLPELIERQIVHLGLEAKVRLYRYEQWIPAKWAELHGLFSLACTRQIERRPIDAERGRSSTIEHAYLTVLILQLMNAGNLTARHLEWVARELDEWCAPLRLTLEPSSVSSFYVDLSSREGLKRRSPAPLEGRVLFLDTRPLHAVLTQNIVMIEQKIRHQPLSDKTPRRTDQLTLLTKLAAQVDPEYRPFARRGERTAAVGVVDAIVGFPKIAGYLREEERDPLPKVDTGKSYGGTMEIAVFGHVRNEDDRRRELARRRLAAFAPPGGPWDAKDVSQTGYRLVAPMSAASLVTLNTLTAIRPHGHTYWALGIVRRMKRLTADRAEIGLQVIANTIISVDLIEQRRTDADYSVDGEAVTVGMRSFHGLFLALRKKEGENAVQSLIVPASEYQPARRFRLATSRSTTPIRFGRLIEQQPDWVWAAIEPQDLPGSSQSPPSIAPEAGFS